LEPRRDVAATPKLKHDVAIALDGGLKFLQRTFSSGDGAMPTPDDPAIRAKNAQRMASGEGAADDEEVANIDQQIDPQGQYAEGDKAMLRMAKIHQWYLEHGQGEKAGAAAASLLQFGAQRAARIGGVAAAAYSKYLETKDPKDLDAVAGLLEKAYDMIPNGANADISINPETGTLQVEKTDAEGNRELTDIKPGEIPNLIQSAMTGSGYWGEIAKIADPKGYQSRLDEGRQIREGERDYARTKATEGRTQKEWDRQHGVLEEDKTETEKRAQKEWDRQHGITKQDTIESETRAADTAEKKALLDAAIKIREDAGKPKEDKLDPAAFDEAVKNAAKAKKLYAADQTPENKELLDAFVAEAYRASGHDAAKLRDLGFDTEATDLSAEKPPFEGWTKNVSQKDGKTYWVSPDGTQKTPAGG
jgi:hypothetical protein